MKFAALFLTLGLLSVEVWGHGEDRPGPNGGFIRMPGAFHVEVIPSGKRSLKVFLLDINWKSPSVKDSSLFVSLKTKKTVSAKCESKTDYYICEFPAGINLNNKGQLFVNAKREGQQGNVVNYELPLKLQIVDDGHGGHH